MPFHILVAATAMAAAAIASISGFGIGSLLTPLVAAQYGMKTAVGAVAVPHFAATLLRFCMLRGAVERRVLFQFGLMNAAGSLAGAIIHNYVENPTLTIVLGALLVFAGALGLTGYADRMRFGPKTAWIAGIASGGFGGLVGNQGGIRAAAMLGFGIAGSAFVATATAIGLAVDAVRLPVYFATGFRQIVQAWPAIVTALAGVVAGTLLGARLLRRIPQKIFRKVVSSILFGVGVFLLANSV